MPHAGDELFIPKGSVQGGRVKEGTRSIHAFGGMRVCPFEIVNYSDEMKEDVLAFLSDEFKRAGKRFEPGSRHKIYQDIKNNFILFLCMKDCGKIIGTAALCKLSESDCTHFVPFAAQLLGESPGAVLKVWGSPNSIA
ncbi:MAG: hypothetical protein IJ727_11830 [Treponema sp.]|nr:hypothetical protein [Treponema sp.]